MGPVLVRMIASPAEGLEQSTLSLTTFESALVRMIASPAEGLEHLMIAALISMANVRMVASPAEGLELNKQAVLQSRAARSEW